MTNESQQPPHKDPLSRLLGDRDPLEVARELFVYAPIGVASRFSKDLPGLIEEGRNKYSIAKVMGTFAAQQGRRQFKDRVRGWVNPSQSDTGSTTTTAATDTTATTVEPDVEAPAPTTTDADLPIARYDTLSATQVLSHLANLSAEQRAAVADYERNHRNRRTILNRITHLDSTQS